MGHTSEFLFGIYWWTWKNYLKNCWSEPIKNVRILIFTMLYFSKKVKKNTWRYHYFTPVYQNSWWYDLQFLGYRVWQTEIGNHGSTFSLLPPPWKPEISKFKKNCWRYHHFTYVYQIIRGSVPETWSETKFFVTLGHFLTSYTPTSPPTPQNNNNLEHQNLKK